MDLATRKPGWPFSTTKHDMPRWRGSAVGSASARSAHVLPSRACLPNLLVPEAVEEAEVAHASDELVRIAIGVLERRGARAHLTFDELPDPADQRLNHTDPIVQHGSLAERRGRSGARQDASGRRARAATLGLECPSMTSSCACSGGSTESCGGSTAAGHPRRRAAGC